MDHCGGRALLALEQIASSHTRTPASSAVGSELIRPSDQRPRWRCAALLRRHAGELPGPSDRTFEIQPQRAHRRHHREAGEEIEPGGKASSIGLDPADGTRAEEAAEIADAVDPGDAG